MGTALSRGARLEGNTAELHGKRGDSAWAAPRVAVRCDEDARPGYQTRKAHECLDEPEVLAAKVRVLAQLLRESRHCVAYTGAGISTASGIQDYATRAGAQSLAGSGALAAVLRSPLEARPTLSHKVMVSLYRAGLLKYWIQQNHDGLPQKAGFPQCAMNEIHGAWFDPSNPVVPMSGQLRTDLFQDLLEWEEKADLVLALGTSMCGMNADRVAISCAERHGTLGTVIVGLQATQHDSLSSLRIFATIDSVMHLLATELNLSEDPRPITTFEGTSEPDAASHAVEQKQGEEPTDEEDVFMVPYGKDGQKTDGAPRMRVELKDGSKVVITLGSYKGYLGIVRSKTEDGHYKIVVAVLKPQNSFPLPTSVMLGGWWMRDAVQGNVAYLPLRNVDDGEASPEQLTYLDSFL